MQELGQVAALLEEVVTILGPIRRDSYEGQTGHKVGHLPVDIITRIRYCKQPFYRQPWS